MGRAYYTGGELTQQPSSPSMYISHNLSIFPSHSRLLRSHARESGSERRLSALSRLLDSSAARRWQAGRQRRRRRRRANPAQSRGPATGWVGVGIAALLRSLHAGAADPCARVDRSVWRAHASGSGATAARASGSASSVKGESAPVRARERERDC